MRMFFTVDVCNSWKREEGMVTTKKKILIIDDEESIRDGCVQVLSRKGYQVESTGRCASGAGDGSQECL